MVQDYHPYYLYGGGKPFGLPARHDVIPVTVRPIASASASF